MATPMKMSTAPTPAPVKIKAAAAKPAPAPVKTKAPAPKPKDVQKPPRTAPARGQLTTTGSIRSQVGSPGTTTGLIRPQDRTPGTAVVRGNGPQDRTPGTAVVRGNGQPIVKTGNGLTGWAPGTFLDTPPPARGPVAGVPTTSRLPPLARGPVTSRPPLPTYSPGTPGMGLFGGGMAGAVMGPLTQPGAGQALSDSGLFGTPAAQPASIDPAQQAGQIAQAGMGFF